MTLAHRAFLAVFLLAQLALAGIWQNQPGRDGGFGHIEILPCAGGLCGS